MLFRSRLVPVLVLMLCALCLNGCWLKVRKLKDENNMLNARILQQQQDAEAAAAQMRATDEKVVALNAKITALEAERSSLQSEIAGLKERAAATTRLMTDAQRGTAEALTKDMEDRVKRENDLKLALDAAAESKLEAATNSKIIAESELATEKAKAAELQKQLEMLSKAVDEGNKTAEALRAERDEARAERDDFRRQAQSLQTGKDDQARAAEKLSNDLREREKDVAAAKRQLAEAQARAQAIDDETSATTARGNALSALLADKLSSFVAAGTVTIAPGREPRVIIRVDQLYQTGTVLLSEDGLKILEAFARAMKDQSFSAIRVEGHSDNTPVKNMPYADNWELAGSRAAAVTRFLSGRSEIPSRKLSSASYAFFVPASTNDTAEGRRQNRRIEIAIIP